MASNTEDVIVNAQAALALVLRTSERILVEDHDVPWAQARTVLFDSLKAVLTSGAGPDGFLTHLDLDDVELTLRERGTTIMNF